MEETSSPSSSKSDSSPTNSNLVQYDGSVEPASLEMGGRRKRLAGDVCAVFVHAGAGYHSIQNERVHLAACEE